MKTKDLFDLYGIPTGGGGRVIPSSVIQVLLSGQNSLLNIDFERKVKDKEKEMINEITDRFKGLF